mmetsp:Transcript_62747/g.136404  ORF Transcript_62747/g.136404 Transcript_62747/m.136404 type:complete len:121 (-) Transcript_62747:14-376(-)
MVEGNASPDGGHVRAVAEICQPRRYGDDFPPMWEAWIDHFVQLHSQGGVILSDEVLASVRCPTLILHGDKDSMVPIRHPKKLAAKISGAVLHHFPEGKHNLHLRYADEFNARVAKFLEAE